MSLFKARVWWSTHVGSNEEFDNGCMVVGNCDNSIDGSMKIVVGSFSGMLRVYRPKDTEFHPTDLVLETDLGQPILQLALGMFVGGEQGLALAVLHPRQLSVYSLGTTGVDMQSDTEIARGAFMTLQPQYTHLLERNCFNMTYGSFGGVYGKHFICVQSVDGQLTFFEQHNPAYHKWLPNFLLPGPLLYMSKTDTFITASSSLQVEGYKYSSISSSTSYEQQSREVDAEQKPSVGRRLLPDWICNIGEQVVDIQVGRLSRNMPSAQQEIIVLGYEHLFILKENGEIKEQKRLDYHAMCMCPYALPSTGVEQHNLLLGSEASSLLVQSGMRLVWSAKAQSIPIQIAVASFGHVQGLVVYLDDTGGLFLNYLGTDPALTSVSNLDAKELDYEAIDQEHRQLQAIIRDAVSGQLVFKETQLSVRVQHPSRLEDGYDENGQPALMVTARIGVGVSGENGVTDVSVAVHAPLPYIISQKLIHLGSLNPKSTPRWAEVQVQISPKYLPYQLYLPVTISYLNEHSQPRTLAEQINLPYALVCRVVPPIRTCTHKFLIDTSRMPPPLNLVFDDIIGATPNLSDQVTQVSSNVLSFRYSNGDTATIVASKTNARYQIQADCYEAMYLCTQELINRLGNFYADVESTSSSYNWTPQDSGQFTVSFQEKLPLENWFAVIQQHLAIRHRIQSLNQKLDHGTTQFRIFQKRLLVRFRDKTPTPLGTLPRLLQDTYQSIAELTHQLEAEQLKLKEASSRLSAATSISLLLIRYCFGLDDANTAALHSHISPLVNDSNTVGWEELTEASVGHLLRNVLSKSVKEQVGYSSTPNTLSADTKKLENFLTHVCERLAKGLRIVQPTIASTTSSSDL